MINNLKDEIRNKILKETKYVSERRIERALVFLFALKYNYDNELLSYETMFQKDNDIMI